MRNLARLRDLARSCPRTAEKKKLIECLAGEISGAVAPASQRNNRLSQLENVSMIGRLSNEV